MLGGGAAWVGVGGGGAEAGEGGLGIGMGVSRAFVMILPWLSSLLEKGRAGD